MNKCCECKFWIKESDKWGKCNHIDCKDGMFAGGMLKHTRARYKNNKACKTRFVRKEENE